MADLSLDTLAIHAGEAPDRETGALTPPIHTSAAFKLPGFGPRLFDALTMASHRSPYAYVRWGHPTARMLEEKMVTLAEKVRLFTYATSLGHARSLLLYYPTDLYVDAAPYLSDAQKARIREWTGDGIVRVSVGLEDPQDLIADLDQALRARTVKGLVGPAAYAVLKRMQRK